MRTLLLSAMVAAIVVMLTVSVGGGTASADNPPHVQGTAGATADGCAGCHRAHTAQAEKILVSDQPALCYTCHDAGGTGSDLDVESGEEQGGAALKGGGFVDALINTADASAPPTAAIGILGTSASVTSAHTVDGTAGTVWGNGGAGTGVGSSTFNLTCGNCHDPHGNGNYRILRDKPKGSGVGDPGTSVTDEPGTTRNYGTTDYFDVSYLGSSISNWCATCHTRYLASSGAEKTPLPGDSDFTYRHRSDGSGTAPTCLKCHVAHGTNAVTTGGGQSEAVPWPGGGTPTGENSRLLRMDNRGICQKCHNK